MYQENVVLCGASSYEEKYYFNEDGYALTNWHEIGGKWYYFEPRPGHPLECGLYVTDANGVQDVGNF